MQVLGGGLGGRPLRVPPGGGTRPTSARVRGALFAALEARGAGLAGARVLDLFAGSGAMGIEALSRGAAFAYFVETERRALATIRGNLESLDLLPRSQVVRARVEDVLRPGRTAGGPLGGGFRLILADPPYALGGARVLGLLGRDAGLESGGLCALEHSAREELPHRSGTLVRVWWRVHGGTALSVYAWEPAAAAVSGARDSEWGEAWAGIRHRDGGPLAGPPRDDGQR